MADKKPEAKKTEQKENKEQKETKEAAKPQQQFQKQYKVAKISWNGENPVTPIVLLDKKEREELQIEVGSMVKTKKVGSEVVSIAVVQVQFRELIGQSVATLNTVLATKLGVGINDKIVVVKGVLESEALAFRQSLLENQREAFVEAITTNSEMGY